MDGKKKNYFGGRKIVTQRLLAGVLSAIGVFATGTDVVAAPNTTANSAWNVNTNTDGSDPSQYTGSWPAHTYTPSPTDWRAVSVYQLMTDRFRDGDPNNNDSVYGDFDPRDTLSRHGGDWKGVAERLDYIKSLGFNAIWISPPFQNGQVGSYHGYAPIDTTLLEMRFGNLDDFRAMVKAAHAKGMYVIADMVLNHLSNKLYFNGFQGAAAPFKTHAGEYTLAWRDPANTYADFNFNNTFVPGATYPDIYDPMGNLVSDAGSGSYADSDFHHNGDLSDWGDAYQQKLAKLFGSLDDLRTESPAVQAKVIAMTNAFIASTDVDGFRVDAMHHVDRGFFQNWAPAVRAQASLLGKGNFFIMAEGLSTRQQLSTYVGRGKTPAQWGTTDVLSPTIRAVDALINVRFYGGNSFVDKLKKNQNAPVARLYEELQTDLQAFDLDDPVLGQASYRFYNAFSNHDNVRIATVSDGIAKGKLAAAVAAFWPGIPGFYYGEEQGFKTDANIAEWSREDFMTSAVSHNLSPTNPSAGDNFDMTSAGYLWVQKLMNVRRAYPIFSTTNNVTKNYEQATGGAFAFTRKDAGAPSGWAMVALNAGLAAHTAAVIDTDWNSGDIIANALNPMETYTLGADGELSGLSLDPYGVKVFVLQSALQPLDPAIVSATPTHDSRVNGEPVALTFSDDMNEASVKSAFRFDGASVPAASLNYDAATRTLRYAPVWVDGVHTVEVTTDALAVVGKPLYASFKMRLRKGADNNIIANRDATYDASLVSIVSGNDAILNHNAVGAQYLRTSVDYGKTWSAWSGYAASTNITLPSGAGKKVVLVQYWADGSAQYMVSGSVGGDGIAQTIPGAYLRGSCNGWGTANPMTLVAPNTWEATCPFVGSGPYKFKIDIYGDWSESYGDVNGDGQGDLNGSDISVSVAGAYKVTFNDLTRAYSVVSVPFQGFPSLFIRGSLNNWGATAMTYVQNNVWEALVPFLKPSGNEFKFDVMGDWSQSYGDNGADGNADAGGANIIVANAPGLFKVRFNQLTFAYTVEKQTFDTMFVRGTNNDWAAGAMTQTIPHVWEFNAWFPWVDGQKFKFDAKGDWSLPFGENATADSIADVGGSDINVTQGLGRYKITFNDETLAYSVVKQENFNSVFIAGDYNGWALNKPMTKVGPDLYELEVLVPWHTNQKFKFVGDDWAVADYGDNETEATHAGRAEPQAPNIPFSEGMGKYKVTFNAATLMYSVQKLPNYATMYVRGTFNEWGVTTPMTSLGNGRWTVDITVTAADSQFKFDANGDWAKSFGDNAPADGNAEPDGTGIGFAKGAGQYRIVFDDAWLTYTVTKINLQLPVANAGADITVDSGQSATFDGSASSDADGGIASHAWDSGAIHLTGVAPTYTFATAGDYTFTLTVTDVDGLTATDEVVVHVIANKPPKANAGMDKTIAVGGTVTFDGSLSTDEDGSIVSYAWSNGLAGVTATKKYDAPGSYNVTLTVTDDDGATATDDVKITVTATSVYPKMYFRGTPNKWGATLMQLVGNNTWQIEATFGSTTTERFKFDASTNWALGFGDNAPVDGIADKNGSDIKVSKGAGLYRITFNDKTRAYTVVKIGGNIAPIANAGADQTVQVGATVTFNGSGSSDIDSVLVSANYVWTAPGMPTLTGIKPTQSFATTGTYTYTLTVTDANGASATDQVVIKVNPASFAKVYPQVYLRGTNNNFAANAKMVLVANNTWQIDATFGSTTKERFKFDIYGDWRLNFGNNNADLIADQGGADIKVMKGAGMYRIVFNDKTKAYSIVKL